MGQRITFRDRASREDWRRVKFVKGEETATPLSPTAGYVACGDGTAFPIQVTLRQLWEMIFRVKDAWFTAGQLDFTSDVYPFTIYAPTTAPANRALKSFPVIDPDENIQRRGYTKTGSHPAISTPYNAGYGYYYTDAGNEESRMWDTEWNWPPLQLGFDAFSYYSKSLNNSSDWWYEEATYFAQVEAFRGNRVAVVKVDPSDDFYASTNKFYIEFEFSWLSAPGNYDPPPEVGGTNIYNPREGYGDVSSGAFVNCNYIIRLQTGDVSCPMYCGGGGGSVITSASGTDIIHEAKKWWPYKTKAGDPAWDTDTGQTANDGALG